MQPVIQTQQLSKVYQVRGKASPALDSLNLEIQQGEIFGYLGPNGAGKSTTIHLLLGLIRPTTGHAKLFGVDAIQQGVEARKRIGFLPAELSLWKSDSAKEVLSQVALMRGNAKEQMKTADQLAQRLSLDLSKKVRDFSTGNKRKLGLVLAMMHTPDLLILDEPTSGLDPLLQQEFNQMMLEVRQQGRTVFLSSHVLNEVQTICNRVGILRGGQLKAVESVEKLTQVGFRNVTVTLCEKVDVSSIRNLTQVTKFKQDDLKLHFQLSGEFTPLIQALAHFKVQDILVTEPTLEEIFLSFYGGNGHHTQEKSS
jgi:ABC-2 type transport system ATP-binding protein